MLERRDEEVWYGLTIGEDGFIDHSFLAEDDTAVRADSEIVLEWDHGEPNRVVIFIDGYDGSLTANI